jgi:hypothetical protein
MLDCGAQYPKCKWLSVARTAVLDHFYSRWAASCMMYKSLEHFQVYVPNISLSAWWSACKFNPELTARCRTILALLTGSHALGTSRGRFTHNSRICQNCDMYVEESLTHFLMECESLSEHRGALMDTVRDKMPPAMVQSMAAMTAEQQAQFLLGELGNSHVPDWYDIHRAVINMCYRLYKARDACQLQWA